mgnify:CR=1 FL=1
MVANCLEFDQVDRAAQQVFQVLLEVEVLGGEITIRWRGELGNQIDVATLDVEVAPRDRTKSIQPLYAVLAAEPGDILKVSFDQSVHGLPVYGSLVPTHNARMSADFVPQQNRGRLQSDISM